MRAPSCLALIFYAELIFCAALVACAPRYALNLAVIAIVNENIGNMVRFTWNEIFCQRSEGDKTPISGDGRPFGPAVGRFSF